MSAGDFIDPRYLGQHEPLHRQMAGLHCKNQPTLSRGANVNLPLCHQLSNAKGLASMKANEMRHEDKKRTLSHSPSLKNSTIPFKQQRLRTGASAAKPTSEPTLVDPNFQVNGNGIYHERQQNIPSQPPSNIEKADHDLSAARSRVAGNDKKFSNHRIFTGRVQKIREWISVDVGSPCLYVIHGILLSPVKSTSPEKSLRRIKERKVVRKAFILGDVQDKAQKLRCILFEIDRKIDNYSIGTRVKVTGKLQPDGTILAINLEPVKSENSDKFLARLENFGVRGIRMALKQAQIDNKENLAHAQ